MTKLNKKLSLSISVVVILVSLISLCINNMFVHKYYLHEKKKIINSLGNEIRKMSSISLIENIESMEKKYKATIVYVPINTNYLHNENIINQELLNEFWKKDITLKKFWISDETLLKIEDESVNKIYNQGKSKYSLLVKFIKKDSYIFAAGIPIEHSQETIKIINRFYIIISLFSIVLIIILTFILSNKIIKPLEKLRLLANDISKLNFRKEDIKTNDEIEELSKSVNEMSISLENAHNELNKRNENLKIFISDASHEMKTPIALIKAYSMGIQDGIDDGTYIDTIIEQAEHMNDIINTLLYWAKYEKKEINLCKFDLKEKLLRCMKNYDAIIEKDDIEVNINIDNSDFMVNADENSIEIVLDNLISNAIKYNSDKKIDVFLLKNNEEIFLSISNGIKDINKNELDNIWKPFYVLEKSRYKEVSGTGLGLSIVKEILESHNLKYGVELCENKIKFSIIFKNL